MSPQGFNPLTAPLSLLKQVGEQTNIGIQTMGSGMAQAVSSSLDALMGIVPGGNPSPNPGPRGNPRSPNPQQLLPRNLTQALSRVENVILPPGLPRISTMLAPRAPAPPAPPAPARPPAPPAPAVRRRVAERRGV